MGKRKIAISVLFVVNMFMLAINVLPHHHHNGMPCLTAPDSEQSTSDEQRRTPADQCSANCIANFSFIETASSNHHNSAQHFVLLILVPRLPEINFSEPEISFRTEQLVFIDSLHGRSSGQALGLRAPPHFG